MTLTQLKYIVETAETGTISKAAEKLYISQPSLTAAIRDEVFICSGNGCSNSSCE